MSIDEHAPRAINLPPVHPADELQFRLREQWLDARTARLSDEAKQDIIGDMLVAMMEARLFGRPIDLSAVDARLVSA